MSAPPANKWDDEHPREEKQGSLIIPIYPSVGSDVTFLDVVFPGAGWSSELLGTW
jgi:hypothetical protein